MKNEIRKKQEINNNNKMPGKKNKRIIRLNQESTITALNMNHRNYKVERNTTRKKKQKSQPKIK